MSIMSSAKIKITFLTLIMLFALPLSVIAGSGLDQDLVNNACDGITGEGIADCGQDTGVTDLVANVLNILSFVVGAAAVIGIVIGGLRYVVTSGDPQGAAAARNTIIYSVVGLVVALAAQGIVRFVLNNA